MTHHLNEIQLAYECMLANAYRHQSPARRGTFGGVDNPLINICNSNSVAQLAQRPHLIPKITVVISSAFRIVVKMGIE